MPQAGIITIRLEAFFVYGIWDTNRLRFKIACYFFISIYGTVAQFFFNAEQLVVFRHTVATAQLTGFNLSAIGGYGDIRNGSISVSPERWLVTVV